MMKLPGKILYLIAISLLRLIACLPLGVLYIVSDMMFIILYHVVRYRRILVRNNLLRVFDHSMEQHEIENVEKRFYHHLCDIFVETVKLLRITDKGRRRLVEIHGINYVREAVSQGHSIMLMFGHIGNWELFQEITNHLPETLSCIGIYKPLRPMMIDNIVRNIRQCFRRNILVTQNDAIRTAVRMRKMGKQVLLYMISDQRPSRHQLQNWALFLGQDTPFITGVEHLGRKMDMSFFYIDVQKPKRGHYVFTLKPIVNDHNLQLDYPLTRTYLSLLEDNIRKQPELWLWSHDRWKHQRLVLST